jgi:hypothetical protein
LDPRYPIQLRIPPSTRTITAPITGRGWADIKTTTADNTYTGKGGSKRD